MKVRQGAAVMPSRHEDIQMSFLNERDVARIVSLRRLIPLYFGKTPQHSFCARAGLGKS
jgi:hypothetical protein